MRAVGFMGTALLLLAGCAATFSRTESKLIVRNLECVSITVEVINKNNQSRIQHAADVVNGSFTLPLGELFTGDTYPPGSITIKCYGEGTTLLTTKTNAEALVIPPWNPADPTSSEIPVGAFQ